MPEYDVAVAVFLRVEGVDEGEACSGAEYAVRNALRSVGEIDERGVRTVPIVVLGRELGRAKLADVQEVNRGNPFVMRPSTQVYRDLNEQEGKTDV